MTGNNLTVLAASDDEWIKWFEKEYPALADLVSDVLSLQLSQFALVQEYVRLKYNLAIGLRSAEVK